MMTFSEYCERELVLKQGVIRASALSSFASQARMYGDKSKQAFQNGMQVLEKRRSTDDIEVRLQRIEDSIDAILRGLAHQRDQIGSNVALNFVGHSLSNKKQN
ncbi:MAG: hypothetical protein HWD92_13475 [Flavobacteriia bacterium]|nr:hypothetical protein [Flavobacteriia bacterium]